MVTHGQNHALWWGRGAEKRVFNGDSTRRHRKYLGYHKILLICYYLCPLLFIYIYYYYIYLLLLSLSITIIYVYVQYYYLYLLLLSLFITNISIYYYFSTSITMSLFIIIISIYYYLSTSITIITSLPRFIKVTKSIFFSFFSVTIMLLSAVVDSMNISVCRAVAGS